MNDMPTSRTPATPHVARMPRTCLWVGACLLALTCAAPAWSQSPNRSEPLDTRRRTRIALVGKPAQVQTAKPTSAPIHTKTACWCCDHYDAKPFPCLHIPRFCKTCTCYDAKCPPRLCPPTYCPTDRCYDAKCPPRVDIPCRFPSFYRCPPSPPPCGK